VSRDESIEGSDRALKNYEGRGKQSNAVPNLGSDPHQGAKFAPFYGLTDAQRAAHERLLSRLPVRTVGDPSMPENWAERDRELSPDELPYLLANKEAA